MNAGESMRIEESDFWSSHDLFIPEQEVPAGWILETFSLPLRELHVMVKEGFVSPVRREGEEYFDSTAVKTIAFILVLKRQMGVNMAGIEIILHLRKQIHWHLSRNRPRIRTVDP